MNKAEEDGFIQWLRTLPEPAQRNILEAWSRGESITRDAWKAAVAQERERCAKAVRALYDDWMQNHGIETGFDAGRLGGLYSAEDAIRKGE